MATSMNDVRQIALSRMRTAIVRDHAVQVDRAVIDLAEAMGLDPASPEVGAASDQIIETVLVMLTHIGGEIE